MDESQKPADRQPATVMALWDLGAGEVDKAFALEIYLRTAPEGNDDLRPPLGLGVPREWWDPTLNIGDSSSERRCLYPERVTSETPGGAKLKPAYVVQVFPYKGKVGIRPGFLLNAFRGGILELYPQVSNLKLKEFRGAGFGGETVRLLNINAERGQIQETLDELARRLTLKGANVHVLVRDYKPVGIYSSN